MFFKSLALLYPLTHIVGVALWMAAQDGAAPLATVIHALPDTSAASIHSVNRTLKADKLVVRPVEPAEGNSGTTDMPRRNVPSSEIKIGCERPFGAMVKTTLIGRCIAGRSRGHSTAV